MTDIADVVTGLAARLRAGLGGQQIAGRIFDFSPDAIDPPCAIVLPSAEVFVEYDATMDGLDEFSVLVRILQSTAVDRAGQAQLMAYFDRAGSSSFRAAVYAEQTLGGIVTWCKVRHGTAWGDVEHAGVVYFGGELIVDCGT